MNLDTLKLCNRYQVPCADHDVKSIVTALEYGTTLSNSSRELYGPKAITAFKPIPQANFMPTGGVALDNVEDWIVLAVAVVGQSQPGRQNRTTQASPTKQFVEN